MRFLALVFLSACGGAAVQQQAVNPTGPVIHAQTQVITPTDGLTERELLLRGERAMLEQRWKDAISDFELLLRAQPSDQELVKTATLDLALSYQGAGEYAKAREWYEKRLALGDDRTARARLFAVLAYLEDWAALGKFADQVLTQNNLEPMDKMTAIGARALSKVEANDVESASRDLQRALDIMEEQHYGTGGRLPGPAAQLEFVQGEVRRMREEMISFMPIGHDFLAKMNARCQGLLDAQASYADAMRSEDPFWATISGYRVGQMYRALHRDLMSIPPTDLSKSTPNTNLTEKQKQIFFGIMHVRYRVLLEKGGEMMKRTYDFAVKNGDQQWMLRSLEAKKDVELAIEEEKAAIARLPFAEKDIEDAIKLMEQHYNEQQAKKSK